MVRTPLIARTTAAIEGRLVSKPDGTLARKERVRDEAIWSRCVRQDRPRIRSFAASSRQCPKPLRLNIKRQGAGRERGAPFSLSLSLSLFGTVTDGEADARQGGISTCAAGRRA